MIIHNPYWEMVQSGLRKISRGIRSNMHSNAPGMFQDARTTRLRSFGVKTANWEYCRPTSDHKYTSSQYFFRSSRDPLAPRKRYLRNSRMIKNLVPKHEGGFSCQTNFAEDQAFYKSLSAVDSDSQRTLVPTDLTSMKSTHVGRSTQHLAWIHCLLYLKTGHQTDISRNCQDFLAAGTPPSPGHYCLQTDPLIFR